MANVLYIGNSASSSTSSHRFAAIKRLGHSVTMVDLFHAFTNILHSRWMGRIHYRTGYRLLQGQIAKWLSNTLETSGFKPDVVWVDSGELLGPKSLKILRKLNCPVLLYNVDDPTGKRDGRRFDSLIKAIPFYDLVAVVRKESEQECKALNAKQVLRVYRSYDEVQHKPFPSVTEIPENFRSEVAFIGTWMRYEKRDEFLLELISQGVPVTIWGPRWQNSPFFSQLESHWRGPSPGVRDTTLSGRDYVAAIQGAKICIGLLSKGNRDLHTQRSLEVPFCGGLLCAERTSEHKEMYKEGQEAVFWSDAAECARVCKQLLNDATLRENVRTGGMRRVRSLKTGNEDVANEIITMALRNIS
jgi:spore maturation protein CgeB